ASSFAANPATAGQTLGSPQSQTSWDAKLLLFEGTYDTTPTIVPQSIEQDDTTPLSDFQFLARVPGGPVILYTRLDGAAASVFTSATDGRTTAAKVLQIQPTAAGGGGPGLRWSNLQVAGPGKLGASAPDPSLDADGVFNWNPQGWITGLYHFSAN